MVYPPRSRGPGTLFRGFCPGRNPTQVVVGDYFINHEIRIPSLNKLESIPVFFLRGSISILVSVTLRLSHDIEKGEWTNSGIIKTEPIFYVRISNLRRTSVNVQGFSLQIRGKPGQGTNYKRFASTFVVVSHISKSKYGELRKLKER